MNTTFELLSKSGMSSVVYWSYLLDEGTLQSFEGMVACRTDEQLAQIPTTRAKIASVLDVLRSAPKVPISELEEWMHLMPDEDLARQAWSQGLYAWPSLSNLSRVRQPLRNSSTDLSYERVAQVWADEPRMMEAYGLFIDWTKELTGQDAYVQFHCTAPDLDVNVFSSTKNVLAKIKSGKLTINILSPVDDVLDANSYVVYVVNSMGKEGYLDHQQRLAPLSAAHSFNSLKDCQRAGQSATRDGGVFHILELSLSVGKHIHQSAPDTQSLLGQALCHKDARILNEAVLARSSVSTSRPFKKI